ncbi:non-structural maintenance of chromosomes element 1 homolog [Anneissia japonica]|uniref:non-structural maintenance of chromosomes element 1 homolog n=1 Tax=Anneissia japonica TaxID=1529436 RepID=UPI001425A079|nr:non-structural maintenance of chromosomes element 1 homolog [Anneissia japonica]
MAMTNAHRLCLQSFMTRGMMSEDEVKRLHRHACTHCQVYHVENGHKPFIQIINTNIKPFSMEIRNCKNEDDGSLVYVLVRTAESDICKLISDYHASELVLFQKTIDLIVENNTGTASSTDCLNITLPNSNKMSKKDAQIVLDKFVADKWLQVNQGQISLTPRSMLELKRYLRDIYPDDITDCNICRDIVLKGNSCNNGNCTVRLHFHCCRDYFHGRSNANCPGCATKWVSGVENGTANDSAFEGTSSSARLSRKRKK